LVVNVVAIFLLVAALTASGFGDARGFVHASRIWSGGFAPVEIARSAGWFAVGVGSYWTALYGADRVGIVSPQVQVLLWFVVTVVGVAAITGELREWNDTDKVLAVALVSLLLILLIRREG
jgi:hypothetical protein